MVEKKIFKVLDIFKTVKYYILAQDYGQAEEILLCFDSLFNDYYIEEIKGSDMVWATENTSQILYIIEVEYLDELTFEIDTQKYIVSAPAVSAAITRVINNVGPSYQRILSIERQTAILLQGNI